MESSAMNFGLFLTVTFAIFAMAFSAAMPEIGILKQMPSICSNSCFCFDKHEDYPQDLVDKQLDKASLSLLAPNDKNVPIYRDNTDSEENGKNVPTSTSNTDSEENDKKVPIFRDDTQPKENDCEKESRYDPIYEILDEQERVRVVLQSKNFRQFVRVEKCLKPGRLINQTLHFSDYDLQDYNITCVDKTMSFNFIVLTIDGRSIESVKSKSGIPVCCSCHYNE